MTSSGASRRSGPVTLTDELIAQWQIGVRLIDPGDAGTGGRIVAGDAVIFCGHCENINLLVSWSAPDEGCKFCGHNDIGPWPERQFSFEIEDAPESGYLAEARWNLGQLQYQSAFLLIRSERIPLIARAGRHSFDVGSMPVLVQLFADQDLLQEITVEPCHSPPEVRSFHVPVTAYEDERVRVTWSIRRHRLIAIDDGAGTPWHYSHGEGFVELPPLPAGRRTISLLVEGVADAPVVKEERSIEIKSRPPTLTVTARQRVILGESIVLSWKSRSATHVEIRDAHGEWSAHPPASQAMVEAASLGRQSFQLRAVGPGGTALAEHVVEVVAPPVSISAPASIDVYMGVPATLSWTVTGAAALSLLEENGPARSVPFSASYTLFPPERHMAVTLVATGHDGVEHRHVVNVTAAPLALMPLDEEFAGFRSAGLDILQDFGLHTFGDGGAQHRALFDRLAGLVSRIRRS